MTNPADSWHIRGNIVDVFRKNCYPGTIYVRNGTIERMEEADGPVPDQYILPGFIDAHVHVESSMLIPSQFARLAVVHGTVATVSDPHEIANVLGAEGVHYMISDGKRTPFKFYFGAPSCVPATSFETAGAVLSAADIEALFARPEVRYLAEMMNWPGVLSRDSGVLEKIAIARKHKRPVDGHAPGLRGTQAVQYALAGISTDHECFTAEEALDKLAAGMHIIIREGSAAKNFDALADLLHGHSAKIMFCSDDKHPDSLVAGHINELVRRAVARGIDVYKVLQAACVNPVLHYSLDVGLLRPGDPADFIVVDNLRQFSVQQTYIQGQLVAEGGNTRLSASPGQVINHFRVQPKTPDQFAVPAAPGKLRVIEAMDGQLITNELLLPARIENNRVIPDTDSDVLKITVVNRYADTPPAVAFIRNFGLKRGAIASSVAHDSHNIIAVGVNDEAICRAVNLIIEARGGISAVSEPAEMLLPLPVAGLMSDQDGYQVARQYEAIDRMARQMGSTLQAPFMTLSFMALLVIPSLKLSDKGLFNGDTFTFTSIFDEYPDEISGMN
jgi:adenine deaminase